MICTMMILRALGYGGIIWGFYLWNRNYGLGYMLYAFVLGP